MDACFCFPLCHPRERGIQKKILSYSESRPITQKFPNSELIEHKREGTCRANFHRLAFCTCWWYYNRRQPVHSSLGVAAIFSFRGRLFLFCVYYVFHEHRFLRSWNSRSALSAICCSHSAHTAQHSGLLHKILHWLCSMTACSTARFDRHVFSQRRSMCFVTDHFSHNYMQCSVWHSYCAQSCWACCFFVFFFVWPAACRTSEQRAPLINPVVPIKHNLSYSMLFHVCFWKPPRSAKKRPHVNDD